MPICNNLLNNYKTIFNVHLTLSKMNIVMVFPAQSDQIWSVFVVFPFSSETFCDMVNINRNTSTRRYFTKDRIVLIFVSAFQIIFFVLLHFFLITKHNFCKYILIVLVSVISCILLLKPWSNDLSWSFNNFHIWNKLNLSK